MALSWSLVVSILVESERVSSGGVPVGTATTSADRYRTMFKKCILTIESSTKVLVKAIDVMDVVVAVRL